jgi:uncharacterized protein (TIGR02270 family)
MAGPTTKRPIPWELHQAHLDEGAFLWEQWELSLEAANYTLGEVAVGPEERLLAHLDALVLGGAPVAKKLLVPALADPALARPAAWALLAAEDADHFDQVLGALASAEPPLTNLLARAMALSSHPAVTARVGALWVHAEAPLRALLLSVMETRDLAWAAAQLGQTLTTSEPALLLPSLRLLRRSGLRDPAFANYLEYAMASPDPAVRAEAAACGVLLGSRSAWDTCRREVMTPASGRLPMALLALSPQPHDRQLLHERLRDPATRRPALWALGFAGDLEAADATLAYLADEALGPLAADSFCAITGLVIDGSFRAAGVTKGPDTEEVGEDDPPPEVRPEDFLPAPNPIAVEDWWRAERPKFKPNQRYLGGQPRAVESLRAAMVEGATWRRAVLAIELALTSRAPVNLDLRDWARAQLRALAAPAAPAARPAAARR